MLSQSPPLDALVVPSEDYHQVHHPFCIIPLIVLLDPASSLFFFFQFSALFSNPVDLYFLTWYLFCDAICIYFHFAERICVRTRQAPRIRFRLHWKCRFVTSFKYFLDAFSVLVCFFIIVASIGLGFKLPPVSAFSCNCFNSTYRVLSIQLIGSRGSKNCFYNFEKELRFLVVCYTAMPWVVFVYFKHDEIS